MPVFRLEVHTTLAIELIPSVLRPQVVVIASSYREPERAELSPPDFGTAAIPIAITMTTAAAIKILRRVAFFARPAFGATGESSLEIGSMLLHLSSLVTPDGAADPTRQGSPPRPYTGRACDSIPHQPSSRRDPRRIAPQLRMQAVRARCFAAPRVPAPRGAPQGGLHQG